MALTRLKTEMIDQGGYGATVTPAMFGGVEGFTVPQDAVFQAAANYLAARGGGILDVTGNWCLKNGFGLTSGAQNIAIISNGGRIKYLKTDAPFYHMIRINGCANIRVRGINTFSDASLVRGETGFSIQVSASYGVRISECEFQDVMQPVWIDTTQDIWVVENKINSARAGGIQFSDGCVDFIASFNTINLVEDDAIAVVRDVGGTIPNSGTIVGNVCREISRGHGICLISCLNVTVSANMLYGFRGAAIGSYIWSGTTDRARDLIITGNIIRNTCRNPENAASSSSMLFVGTEVTLIAANDIQGPGIASAAWPEQAAILLDNYNDITIMDNKIHDSLRYGVYVRNESGSTKDKLKVLRNDFTNILQAAVRAAPTAGNLGSVFVHGNTFTDVAYSGGTGNAIDIARAFTSRVYVGANKNFNASRPYRIQASTCTNVAHEDNTPVATVSG